jgi:hypothetical protein
MHGSTFNCYYHDDALSDSVKAAAIDSLPTICDNLVGVNSKLGFFLAERRANCLQMPPAPSQLGHWKYDFVITRTKEADEILYLDNSSCQNAMTQILTGNINGCGSEQKIDAQYILGGTQQVGVFLVQ